jgi:hypothetical protein
MSGEEAKRRNPRYGDGVCSGGDGDNVIEWHAGRDRGKCTDIVINAVGWRNSCIFLRTQVILRIGVDFRENVGGDS